MAQDRSVLPENMGFRDMDISNRHRTWGWDCPAVDIDFLMCEYNFGKPIAIIEYKYYKIGSINENNITYRVLKNLADERIRPIPFFIVLYWREIWAFRVIPMNAKAEEYVTKPTTMTEYDYVSLLYRIRRNMLKDEISEKLNKLLPDEE